MPSGNYRAMVISLLLARDGDSCFVCGEQVAWDDATVEHVTTKGEGGGDSADNLAVSHFSCNLARPRVKRKICKRGHDLTNPEISTRHPQASLSAVSAGLRISRAESGEESVPRRSSTPDARAADAKKRVDKVRRRYNKNVNKNKVIRPGEVEFVEQMVCILKLGRYSNTQVAKVIGIGRAQVAEILERPHVTEMLTKLQAAVPEAALSIMEGFAIEAVVSIADVMRTSEDDKYVLQAAAEILDRTGLPKVSKQERKTTDKQDVEITGDSLVSALRQASPEVQEEAAVIVEQLEELLARSAEAGDESEDTDE